MFSSLLDFLFPARIPPPDYFNDSEDELVSKMSPVISALRPSTTINGALSRERIHMKCSEWLEALACTSLYSWRDPQLEELDRCIVDSVDHFRTRTPTQGPHEGVAFEFHLAPKRETDVGVTVNQNDRRAGFVHRIIADSASNHRKSQAFNSSTSSSSLPPDDLIRIDANYQTLNLVKGQWCKDPRYVLLRNFTIPRGVPLRQRLTVLDCAILASVISDRAEHYSQLGHMCMWFAATFYLAAYRICHNRAGVHMKSQEKREFRFAGKWKKFQMVDQHTGDLLFRQAGSLQTLKEAIRKGMEKRGESQETMDRYLRMVDEDAALWEENEKIDGRDTIGAIIVLFEARRKQIRQGMTDKIQLAQEAKLQERRTIEEKARKEERQLAEQRETQLKEQLNLAETQLKEQKEQLALAELRLKAAEQRAQAAEQYGSAIAR